MTHPFIRAWLDDARGNVIVFFALVLVPILIAVGFTLDISRQINAGRHLQIAVDAAALAGARAMEDASMTASDIEPLVREIYHANLATRHEDLRCNDPSVSVDFSSESVAVEADCDLPTMFAAGITSQDLMSIKADSVADADFSKLELVLVLDMSDSMSGDRIAALRIAAKETVAALVGPATGSRVRIAIAPFATKLDAGAYGNAARGRPAGDDNEGDGLDKVCVTERRGAYEFSDIAPMPGTYIPNRIPAMDCPGPSILPLTSNVADLNATIDALFVSGGTAGQLGIAWAWYMLSPSWNVLWPSGSDAASHSDPDTRKVVIIMTDGAFTTFYDELRYNNRNWSIMTAMHTCQAMHAEGIEIFAVGLDLPPSTIFADIELMMSECAEKEENFFTIETGDELYGVYQSIVSGLKGVAIEQ